MEKQNSAAILLLKQATTLNIHTGNLVNWSRLKKKCPSSTSEELQGCIRETLSEWCTKIAPTLEKEAPSTLECTLTQATEAITPEEREELKVSVKLFLSGSDPTSIRMAVDLACSTLGVSQLDSVMIAPPPLPEGVSLTLEHLQPYWEELENLLQSHKIAAIGTSDLDKPLLEQLYTWAQVKPSSNQVNLASCCVMPPDLTAFAKEYDIQLLTHNDTKELITETSFQESVSEGVKDAVVADWSLEWVLRYSIIVKSRGIIKSKGYLVQAKRIRS
ncbi:Glutamate--cysteine ligase regulatory subunit [Acipenser ruthenus]|uniref:Glutamate--cysteine ligase regulatory subunit n=1 Tax=Acipenser ruthenus TaxID=7906 RepID=A0A444U0V3_ACIRT|nr:Glutamate--cysteine ligase regulatory subunit [Acipenser ruthenus]